MLGKLRLLVVYSALHKDLLGKLPGLKAGAGTGSYSDPSGHSEDSTWIYSLSVVPFQYLIHISPSPVLPC